MMARAYTTKILDLLDQGMFSEQGKDDLIASLLSWLSEDDVKDFYYANCYSDYEENDDV